MKSLFISITFLLVYSNIAYSIDNYAGSLNVRRIHVSNEICYVGTDSNPTGTCSEYNRQFKFSLKNNQGKAMYSIFIGAKLSGKKIDIWYTPSTAPGTDQTNGCNDTTMAIATQAGFSM
jgi:hypothetical protein